MKSIIVTAAAVFGLRGNGRASAFNVGKRRIRCTPLPGDPSALVIDPDLTLPAVATFVAAQAVLPSLAACPQAVQAQVPWYHGDGPGFCPVEYWNLAALAPGVAVLGAALALRSYILKNRLVVTEKSLRSEDGATLIEMADVADWSIGPLGLTLTSRASGEKVYVPPFWNGKDVEALLGERIPA